MDGHARSGIEPVLRRIAPSSGRTSHPYPGRASTSSARIGSASATTHQPKPPPVPQAVGALPPQLAALMRTNVNVQELTVEAALTGSRQHVHHAAMLDPHTAAELPLDEIRRLVDELLGAHGDLVPELH